MRARNPAVEPFCHHLLVVDLPALPPERRAAAVGFTAARASTLPTPMRIGVGLVAAVGGGGAAVSPDTVASPGCWPRRPLPLVGEYVRLRALARLTPTSGRRGPTPPPTARGPRARERRRRASATPPLDVPTCSSSAPAPAARRRRRCSPRPGFDVARARGGRAGRARARWCRSRSSRWTASTAPAASPPPSACPSIAYTEGCCAGGGTEINSGLYRRPPEEVLDRWRDRARARRLRRRRARTRSATRSSRSCRVQTVPGAPDRGQRGAAPRRRRARLAPRRDPPLDGLPRRAGRPRRAAARA